MLKDIVFYVRPHTEPHYKDWPCSLGSPQMRYLTTKFPLPEFERAANLKKLPKMGVFGDFLSILPNRPNF